MKILACSAATLMIVALLSVSLPAAADELIAPPLAKVSPGTSPLPDDLEGLRFGESLSDLRARLEGEGWKLRERTQTRRGVALLRIYAKHRSHAALRGLKLLFAEDRLVSVRAAYRQKDLSRLARFEKACANLDSVGYGERRKGCVDATRTRILEYEADGRRAEIVDLAAGLRLGVVTRAKLERRLRNATRPAP